MENLLTIQENKSSAALIFYSADFQELCTDVNSNVISDVAMWFSARHQQRQARTIRMPNMPRGRTSPALPYKKKKGLFYTLSFEISLEMKTSCYLSSSFPSYIKTKCRKIFQFKGSRLHSQKGVWEPCVALKLILVWLVKLVSDRHKINMWNWKWFMVDHWSNICVRDTYNFGGTKIILVER